MPQMIEVRNSATGESFEWHCPDDLWMRMRTFAMERRITVNEVVVRALDQFFAARPSRQSTR